MKKKITFINALILISLWASNLSAEMLPRLKNRVGIPPFQVMKEVIQTNYSLKKAGSHSKNSFTPYLTWLADADPRIHPGLITSSHNIYVIRNLGNQVNSSLATLDYGIRHLHTPLLLITGSSGSDAIRLFNEGYEGLEQSIRLDLDHLHLPLAKHLNVPMQKETELQKVMRLVEANVDYQVELAAK